MVRCVLLGLSLQRHLCFGGKRRTDDFDLEANEPRLTTLLPEALLAFISVTVVSTTHPVLIKPPPTSPNHASLQLQADGASALCLRPCRHRIDAHSKEDAYGCSSWV
eukprot:scaffold1163_cov193-Alexandrium_tamarense.AAC.16